MTALPDAYRALLDAATAGSPSAPPPGEWTTDQILAHVTLVNVLTISAVAAVAAGSPASYDNRSSQDPWTLDRIIVRAGGTPGLCDRIRRQGEALCALTDGRALSDAELDTPVPALLLSGGAVLVDQPLPLRDLLAGLAEVELPGHTRQLLALA